MKPIIKIISLLGLVLTLIPSFLVFYGITSLDNNKLLMLLGTIIWFVTAPSWMNEKS